MSFGGFGGSSAFGAKPNIFGATGGGGAFGAKPSTPTSGFGAATTPAFGSAAGTSPSAFGIGGGFRSTSGGGLGAGFGSSTIGGSMGGGSMGAFGAGGNAAFGSAAPAFGSSTPAFGAGGSGFGSPAPTFGSPSAFGASGMGAGFGAMNRSSSPATTGAFGGSTGGFGMGLASKPLGAASTSPFGGGAFGAAAPATPFGGAAPATPFGGAPAFGQQSQGFGAPAGGGGFGMMAQTSGTGNPPFAPVPLVESGTLAGTKVTNYMQHVCAMPQYEGKSQEELRFEDYQRNNRGPPASGQAGFGGAFGAPAQSGFGSAAFGTQPTPAFGGHTFGAPAAAPFRQSSFGTPATGFGSTANTAFGSANATPAFGSQPSSFGATFGSGPAFGAAPASAAASPFGQTTTPAFGQPFAQPFGQSSAAPAFGQPAAPAFGSSFPSFGQGAASSFGAAAPQTPAFGATSAFGQPAAGAFGSSIGGFGQPSAASASPFGGATSAFGQSSSAPMFGQPAAGGFGSTPSAGAPFGQSTTASAFGQPAPSGFGSAFGQPASLGAFGSSKPAFGSPGSGFGAPGFGASQPSGFGQSAFGSPGFGGAGAGAFGSSGFGGGFGQGVSSFGQQPATGAPQIPVPQTVSASDDNLYSSLGRKLELLRKKKDSLELSEKESRGDASLAFDRASSFSLAGAPSASTAAGSLYSRHTPISAAKIAPRGFLSKESPPLRPASSSSGLVSTAAENRIFSPDRMLNRSAMKLILDASRVIEDPTLHLPAPSKASATPLRASDGSSQLDSAAQGEKTWLTPAATESPALPKDAHANPSSNLFSAQSDPSRSASKADSDGKAEGAFSFLRSQDPIVEPQVGGASAEDRGDGAEGTAASVLAPTLLRKGYGVTPSLEVLQRMTESELSCVQDFSVFRPNVGEIKWAGETDVRGLDLDRVVRIEQSEVVVYEAQQGLDKPPEGQGLNKRAVITLFNVFPKASASYQKQIQFEAKLRKICDDSDADFHYYDADRGEWCFSVDHFSRYGLTDDSDDEPCAAAPAERLVRPKSIVGKFHGRAAAQAPAALESPIIVSGVAKLELVVADADPSLGDAAASASDCTSALSSAPKRRRTIDSVSVNLALSLRESTENAFVSVERSPCMELLMKVKRDAFALRGISSALPMYTSLHGTGASDGLPRRMRGTSLAMGRSFRVGWAPNGLIAHSGRPVSRAADRLGASHAVRIERVDPTSWAAAAKAILNAPSGSEFGASLDAILRVSQCVDEGESPLWRPPSAVSDNADEYLRFAAMLKALSAALPATVLSLGPAHPDWVLMQCLLLLDACCGQERLPLPADMDRFLLPMFERRADVPPHLWSRRREFLAQYLQQLAGVQVPLVVARTDGGGGTEAETFERVFDLLSCRRVQEAVAVAEAGGLFRLASLLGQIGGDDSFALLMEKQLQLWVQSDADKTMGAEVLKVYRLLAGAAAECFDYSSLLTETTWTQSLGIVFWYCLGNASRLGDALAEYRAAAAEGQASAPSLVLGGVAQPELSAVFSLLRVLLESPSAANVCAALRPEGFSRDALDYWPPYVLSVVFDCLGMLPADAPVASVTRNHFVAALLAAGDWKWALFVILQQSDEVARRVQCKDTLVRFIGGVPSAKLNETRQFLEGALRIPPSWVDEALGCVLPSPSERAQHLIDAGCWEEANSVICFELAASWIFSTGASLAPLKDLLAIVEGSVDQDDAAWGDSGSVLLQYLRFMEDYRGLGAGDEGADAQYLLLLGKALLAALEHLRLDGYSVEGQEPTVGTAAKHAIVGEIVAAIAALERGVCEEELEVDFAMFETPLLPSTRVKCVASHASSLLDIGCRTVYEV